MCSVCSGMIYINIYYMRVHDLNNNLVYAYAWAVSYFVCFTGISQGLDLADAIDDDEPSEYDNYDDESM